MEAAFHATCGWSFPEMYNYQYSLILNGTFPRNLKRNLQGNIPLLFSLPYAPIPRRCGPLILATNKYHKMHFTCLGLNPLALNNSFTPQIFTKPLFTRHWLWALWVPLTKRVSLKVGTGEAEQSSVLDM